MEQHFIIGKIINTHGIKGELKVLPLTDDYNRFKKLKSILVEKNNNLTKCNVSTVKFINNFVILKLDEINTIEQAQAYKECYIKIDRTQAIKLPKHSYFICDIIGIEVFTDNNELLGIIKDVLQTGGSDTYIVDYNGKDLMIPAVKEFVKSIDINNKKMIVKLIEGLIEL